MAIGARISPEMIVFGTCTRTRNKVWEGERTGTAVEIDTDGGPLQVSYRTRDDQLVPGIGEMVAVWVSAFDGERGSSLSFERNLSPSDVDLLHSSITGGSK